MVQYTGFRVEQTHAGNVQVAFRKLGKPSIHAEKFGITEAASVRLAFVFGTHPVTAQEC